MAVRIGTLSGIQVGNNRKRKFTAGNSSDGTTVAAQRGERNAESQIVVYKLYIRFNGANSFYEVSQE